MAQTSVPAGSPQAVKVTSAGLTGYKANSPTKFTHAYAGKYARPRPRNEKGYLTKRRFGKGNDMEGDLDGLPQPNAAFVKLDQLNDERLQQFALRNFGRRFTEGTPRSDVIKGIRQDMNSRRQDMYV